MLLFAAALFFIFCGSCSSKDEIKPLIQGGSKIVRSINRAVYFSYSIPQTQHQHQPCYRLRFDSQQKLYSQANHVMYRDV